MQTDPRRAAQTELRKLATEANHMRQRYELYQAKGSGAHDPIRLEQLKQLSERAEQRLAEARARV
jgi:hypothetical protein